MQILMQVHTPITISNKSRGLNLYVGLAHNSNSEELRQRHLTISYGTTEHVKDTWIRGRDMRNGRFLRSVLANDSNSLADRYLFHCILDKLLPARTRSFVKIVRQKSIHHGSLELFRYHCYPCSNTHNSNSLKLNMR